MILSFIVGGHDLEEVMSNTSVPLIRENKLYKKDMLLDPVKMCKRNKLKRFNDCQSVKRVIHSTLPILVSYSLQRAQFQANDP